MTCFCSGYVQRRFDPNIAVLDMRYTVAAFMNTFKNPGHQQVHTCLKSFLACVPGQVQPEMPINLQCSCGMRFPDTTTSTAAKHDNTNLEQADETQGFLLQHPKAIAQIFDIQRIKLISCCKTIPVGLPPMCQHCKLCFFEL